MNFSITSLADKDAVKEYIDRLPEGKPFDISITRRTAKRSNPQNNLYHLWKGIIAKETKNDVDTIHKVLCKMFLGVEVVEVLEQKVARIKGTHLLDTKEFTEFLNNVEAFANTELGIILPRPEDKYYETILKQYE